jgi:hypothetical protein
MKTGRIEVSNLKAARAARLGQPGGPHLREPVFIGWPGREAASPASLRRVPLLKQTV